MRPKHNLRTLFLLTLLTIIGTPSFAQYPFEENPSIRYKAYNNWKKIKQNDGKFTHTITIPSVFSNAGDLSIKFTGDSEHDSCVVELYKHGRLFKKFIEPISIGEFGGNPRSVFVEDVNNDGLNDLKIIVPNYACCGAFNFYSQIIFLFQQKNGSFIKISFQDWTMYFLPRAERDFDGDGNYEIVTQTFQNYGKHNYMLFNIYNFNGKDLVNVNKKANYPIMIQLLYDENYKITDKISRSKMKNFERRLPDDHSKIAL